MSLPQLARAAERLRFRLAWHQGGHDARLVELRQELLDRNPWHPIALNFRARAALPETFLPPPPADLAGIGEAFLRGDLDEASQRCAASSHAHARLGRAQLAVAAGETVEDLDGSTVDVLVGRAAQLRARGDLEGARALAVEALTKNPLYGTARVLLSQVGDELKEPILRVPLLAPVQRSEGALSLPSSLSERSRRAWTAWNRAVSSPLNHDLPPGSAGHRALLDAWRRAGPEAAGLRDDPDTEILRLEAWSDSGLLEAYEWSSGLDQSNAVAFRSWAAQGEDSLRRLWSEGLRA